MPHPGYTNVNKNRIYFISTTQSQAQQQVTVSMRQLLIMK